ncbi:MAG: TonB-dependent receptor [Pseudomonadota bacterium]
MSSKTAVCGALFATLLNSSALAQNTDDEVSVLERILIEADNRIATPVDEATRSVTVVTQEEIEEQTATTQSVADILANTVPGFSPSTEGNSDFGQTLRGRTFLTLIDGVPQSTPLRDGRRSLNSINPASIERIEVVRGGNAAFGFGATGGTINIITKRPQEGETKSFVSAGVGFSATNFDDSLRYELQAGTSGREGNVDYVFDAFFEDTDSFFDSEGQRISSKPLGAQGGLAEAETINLLGKIGFNSEDELQRLELGVLYYDLEQDPDFGGLFVGPGAFAPPTGIQPALPGNADPVNAGTMNLNLTANYTHEDFFGSSVDARFYYTDLEITFDKFPGFAQTQIQSEKLGGRVTINTPLDNFIEGASLIWGVDVLNDETIQIGTDNVETLTQLVGPGPLLNGLLAQLAANGGQTDPTLDQFAYAGFAQIEVPIDERLKVSAGVRHEEIEVDVGSFLIDPNFMTTFAFTPGVGGTVDFSQTVYNVNFSYDANDYLQIYGGFSQGFTIGDIGRSLTDQTFAFGDLESEAQLTNNVEVGLRMNGDAWDATVVAFASESTGGETFDQNLNILVQPELIRGVEIAANAQVNDNLLIGGTFAYLDGRVDTNGDGILDQGLPATRIPPTKITAYAEFDPTDWWKARIQGLYVGSKTQTEPLVFGGARDIESYFLVDFYSSFDVGAGTLDVGIKNLFNEEYVPLINQAFNSQFSEFRGPGTTASFRYTIEF